MVQIKPDGLPPIGLDHLIEAYEQDDAARGPYSRNARLARDYFSEIFDGVRLQLDEVFDRMALEGETPHYTYFMTKKGEIMNDAFPIHMMTEPRGFTGVVVDETPTCDEITSPIFLLTRIKKEVDIAADDLTPLILDDLTPIVSTTIDLDSMHFETPIYELPPVVLKGHIFDFEKPETWISTLASYGPVQR